MLTTALASSSADSAGSSSTAVYPKLQLVQIEDSWYALNQTCLQIYQQLQLCGTAELMPVDVVPVHKVLKRPAGSASRTESSPSWRSSSISIEYDADEKLLVVVVVVVLGSSFVSRGE